MSHADVAQQTPGSSNDNIGTHLQGFGLLVKA